MKKLFSVLNDTGRISQLSRRLPALALIVTTSFLLFLYGSDSTNHSNLFEMINHLMRNSLTIATFDNNTLAKYHMIISYNLVTAMIVGWITILLLAPFARGHLLKKASFLIAVPFVLLASTPLIALFAFVIMCFTVTLLFCFGPEPIVEMFSNIIDGIHEMFILPFLAPVLLVSIPSSAMLLYLDTQTGYVVAQTIAASALLKILWNEIRDRRERERLNFADAQPAT